MTSLGVFLSPHHDIFCVGLIYTHTHTDTHTDTHMHSSFAHCQLSVLSIRAHREAWLGKDSVSSLMQAFGFQVPQGFCLSWFIEYQIKCVPFI